MKLDPILVSMEKKKSFLLGLKEDEFRDRVVRPLFTRMGLKNHRETHGADEQGKDCIFVVDSKLGTWEIYAVQTKKGNLNHSRKLTENLHIAYTQIQTSLNTEICIPELSFASKPHKVLLVCSGAINTAARDFILKQAADPRVAFYDSDALIPLIDMHFGELWFGIDSRRNPYLTALIEHLVATGDSIPWSDLGIRALPNSPVTDAAFMPLSVHRFYGKPVRHKGQTRREPEIEEFAISKLLDHQERLILLTGDAGDGKTTVLKRLSYITAQKALQTVKGGKIPIFVKCRDLCSIEGTLLQFTGQLTADISKTGQPAFTSEDLSSGCVVFLFDALDEVPTGADRADVLMKLKELHSTYPRCQIVLTSRPYHSVRTMSGMEELREFRISDFEIRKAKKMVAMIAEGRELPVEATHEIMRKLQSIHGFQMNPLLVTLYAATSDFNRRDLPPNITELFKKYTELMLGRWDLSKGLAQQTQPGIKDFLLQAVAIRMHRDKRTSITVDQFNGILRTCLEERGLKSNIDYFADEILSRSGLIRVDGNEVEFRHMLLQEFFAGRAVENADEFRPHLGDDWWRKPIVFYFGDRHQAYSELEELVKELHSINGTALYNGAISIGLAVQACYLARLVDKRESMKWVLHALVRAYQQFTAHVESGGEEQPLCACLDHFIRARESVATSVIKDLLEPEKDILPGTYDDPSTNDYIDVYRFWCIAGLVEAGDLLDAQKLIKQFKPKDKRMLLALFLGCLLVGSLRISTAEERRLAKEICDDLGPRIAHLTQEVMAEFNTLILELRDGRVMGIAEETDDPLA